MKRRRNYKRPTDTADLLMLPIMWISNLIDKLFKRKRR